MSNDSIKGLFTSAFRSSARSGHGTNILSLSLIVTALLGEKFLALYSGCGSGTFDSSACTMLFKSVTEIKQKIVCRGFTDFVVD